MGIHEERYMKNLKRVRGFEEVGSQHLKHSNETTILPVRGDKGSAGIGNLQSPYSSGSSLALLSS